MKDELTLAERSQREDSFALRRGVAYDDIGNHRRPSLTAPAMAASNSACCASIASSRWETAPSNDEDGVALTLEHLLLT